MCLHRVGTVCSSDGEAVEHVGQVDSRMSCDRSTPVSRHCQSASASESNSRFMARCASAIGNIHRQKPLRSRLRVNPLAVSARRSCNPAANAEITLGSNPMALASASSTRSMSVQRETRFASTHGHGHDLPSNRAGATIRSVQMPKALSPTGHRSSRTTLRMIHTHCASEHHRLARRPFNAAFTVAS